MDKIEVTTHDWFYSAKSNAIFHYDAGNFEAHPATGLETYYPHHTLNVIPADATQILVMKENGYWRVTHYIECYHSS